MSLSALKGRSDYESGKADCCPKGEENENETADDSQRKPPATL